MQNAASGVGALGRQAGGCDQRVTTRTPFNLQDLLNRAMRHGWTPEALGAALALRLDRPRCLLLTVGGLHSLAPDDRVTVAETALRDLHYPTANEREAERQRRQWSQWCAGRRARR